MDFTGKYLQGEHREVFSTFFKYVKVTEERKK